MRGPEAELPGDTTSVRHAAPAIALCTEAPHTPAIAHRHAAPAAAADSSGPMGSESKQGSRLEAHETTTRA